MDDLQWLPEMVPLAAGALTTLLGALAYVWKRDADRKLLDVRRQADDALQQAQQVTALTQAVARLADSWMRSDERATEERRRFSDIVAANTDAQTRLAQTVEASVTRGEAAHTAVRALHDDFLMLQQAVGTLPQTTAEQVQAALLPLLARLDSVRAELAEMRAFLANVAPVAR